MSFHAVRQKPSLRVSLAPPFKHIEIRVRELPADKANDLNALSGVSDGIFHLKIFCLRCTERLAVVARLIETANMFLAGRKHIASITNPFCARLELLG